ncbi:MAG TPA: hypothetical protein GXZ90_06315 [Clostridiales bacterium]|nr:hypothetical protein [Clostridiales bacterium]
MIMTSSKYVIATNEFPLCFYDGKETGMLEIEDVRMYSNECEAQNTLDINFNFDERRLYQVLPVRITYEL